MKLPVECCTSTFTFERSLEEYPSSASFSALFFFLPLRAKLLRFREKFRDDDDDENTQRSRECCWSLSGSILFQAFRGDRIQPLKVFVQSDPTDVGLGRKKNKNDWTDRWSSSRLDGYLLPAKSKINRADDNSAVLTEKKRYGKWKSLETTSYRYRILSLEFPHAHTRRMPRGYQLAFRSFSATFTIGYY